MAWVILLPMDDSKRLAALWLTLLILGALAISGIHCATQPPPEPRIEAWRNERVLMQSKANPARWEALEVMAHDPGQYTRTALTPSQARRWMAEGGFRQVGNQEYNARLSIAGDYQLGRTMTAAR